MNTQTRYILSLFDESTVMAQPWAEAGYTCFCVDITNPPGEWKEADSNIIRVGADILTWLPPLRKYDICFAFPPCTHLATSGARWFKGKGLRALADSISLFHRASQIAEWTEAPYLIENPVSTISTYWRDPDHYFDPCDYGDPYTKRTCLWTGNGFIMPQKNRVSPTQGSRMHRLAPGKDRARQRSETPQGFARAVFTANHKP